MLRRVLFVSVLLCAGCSGNSNEKPPELTAELQAKIAAEDAAVNAEEGEVKFPAQKKQTR